ncbi:MAG: hypothetical protein ACP5GX_00175 [Anaerolineae bacterium]
MEDLGVGPPAIRRTDLTAKGLAEALTLATGDEKIRANTARLGEEIRAETGVENAVRLIEDVMYP